MLYKLRPIKREDALVLSHAFSELGINKPLEIFLSFFSQQQKGERKVFLAEFEGEIAGFISILPSSSIGPFKDDSIPHISDLFVFPNFKGFGIGSKLLETAEKECMRISDKVTFSISLQKSHAKTHVFLSKNGYLPDGTGVWYSDNNIENSETLQIDDNLCLYLIKELKTLRHM